MGSKSVISLLGCGWLGFPLAESLILKGFTVMATTTTSSKLEVLKAAGIDPYLVQFSGAVQIPELKKFFKAETLIITIPPGRKDPHGFENYERMVQFVCNQLPQSKVSRVILISSTSVYPDINGDIDEHSQVCPDTESGQLLAKTEILLAKQNVNTISLRLAGLIGPGRMPGRFFAGKTQVADGLAPVNLIHLDDAVGIILSLIANKDAYGNFNGCAPIHPTREEFYTLAAEIEGLEKPDFISEKNRWKIISSTRLAAELDYQFEILSPMDWLRSIKLV
ncbi:SDR family oxidoreductase [Daejeonella sp.]|uniref:SDR family oxidoreductase n=1 Tax=Daejeonella sp. TaxID=2805397 RepID=UPI0030EE6EF8